MKTTYSRRELYALGEPIGNSSTERKAGGGMIYGGGGSGGGGSSQPTTTNVQNTNIPDYAQPYVESMLGATQQQLFNTAPNASGGVDITGIKPYTPYSTNPQDYVAGFSPMQQQAQQGAANLQDPTQYGAATGMASAAGLGSLNAGQNYANQYTNGGVQQYMNPYIQQSLAPQLQEIQRQADITGQGLQSQATAQGAFGGNRAALQQSENQRNALMAQQQAIGQGYNQAFNNAQQAMQYGAGLNLQGYGQAMQGAGLLGQLGTQQLGNQMNILGAQNQYGAQQQAQQQNIINQAVQNYATAQQYPQQQLAFMNSMLRGLPLQTTTTQTYQAQPNLAQQMLGMGLGAAGMAKAFGG
jgi:hypothetical protein